MDSSTITFLLVVAAAFIVLQWFLKSQPNRPASTRGGRTQVVDRVPVNQDPSYRRPVTASMIEVAQIVCPTATEDQLRYDLERTGSLEATVERYMANGGLPNRPAGGASGSSSSSGSGSRSTTSGTTSGAATGSSSRTGSQSKSKSGSSKDASLISRYHLENRLGEKPSPSSEQTKPKWSQDKSERQAQLRRQQEEMILRARRALEKSASS